MIRTRFLALVTAAGFALSAAAWAQQAYTTRTANVRAGPERDFPVVATLAPGTPVFVAGCLNDYQWCDVDFGAGRGWVNTRALQSYYQNRVVPLYGYGSTLGLPIVSFSLFNYWDRYYRDRPWYHDRPRWEQRWGGNDRRYVAPRYEQPRADYRRDYNDRPRADYNRPQPQPRPYVENRPQLPQVQPAPRQRYEPQVNAQQLQQQQRQQIQQQRAEQRAAQPRQPGQSRVSGDDRDPSREHQGQ
jgi:uncharacterized protein YraI